MNHLTLLLFLCSLEVQTHEGRSRKERFYPPTQVADDTEHIMTIRISTTLVLASLAEISETYNFFSK